MAEVVSQQLLEVSAFCPHACAKTSTPLVNCIVNDGLVNAMPNMQKTVSVHNTCLDKSVCYFQRIFNRNRKLKQQVSKLSAVKLNVCSKIKLCSFLSAFSSRYSKARTSNFRKVCGNILKWEVLHSFCLKFTWLPNNKRILKIC